MSRRRRILYLFQYDLQLSLLLLLFFLSLLLLLLTDGNTTFEHEVIVCCYVERLAAAAAALSPTQPLFSFIVDPSICRRRQFRLSRHSNLVDDKNEVLEWVKVTSVLCYLQHFPHTSSVRKAYTDTPAYHHMSLHTFNHLRTNKRIRLVMSPSFVAHAGWYTYEPLHCTTPRYQNPVKRLSSTFRTTLLVEVCANRQSGAMCWSSLWAKDGRQEGLHSFSMMLKSLYWSDVMITGLDNKC